MVSTEPPSSGPYAQRDFQLQHSTPTGQDFIPRPYPDIASHFPRAHRHISNPDVASVIEVADKFKVETGVSRRGSRRKREARKKDGYPCTEPECRKVFDTSSDLNRHRRIHSSSSDRPHACPVCGHRFLYPKDVKRHMLGVHGSKGGGHEGLDTISESAEASDHALHNENLDPGLVMPDSLLLGNMDVAMRDQGDYETGTTYDDIIPTYAFESGTSNGAESRTESPTSQYMYGALDEGQIRVLTLFPARSQGERIRLRLTHHYLEQASYDALSYAWGDESRTNHVYIDNCSSPVRSNLFSALQHLRRHDGPRYLWVDAICIDQSNLDERASQVHIMHKIYMNAATVCVWLGEHHDDSSLAMDFLKGVAAANAPETVANIDKLSNAASNPDGHERLRALAALMDRPWFSRLWVMQEIALARAAHVYCGNAQVPWLALEETIGLLTSMPLGEQGSTQEPQLQNQVSACPDFKRLGAGRFILTKSTWTRIDINCDVLELRFTLIDLLSTSWSLECTDPHDRIYALLPLAKDAIKIQSTYRFQWPDLPGLIPERSLNLPLHDGDVRSPANNGAVRLPPSQLGTQDGIIRLSRIPIGDDQYHGLTIRPDYTMSFVAIYKQAVKLASKSGTLGNLDILCRPWGQESKEGLPSWVSKGRNAPFSLVKEGQAFKSRVLKRTNADPLVGLTTQDGPYYRACGTLLSTFGYEWGFQEDERCACYGAHALHYACSSSRIHVVRRLLDAGADINARAYTSPTLGARYFHNDIMTPLDLAVKTGLTDIASFLIAHGAHHKVEETAASAQYIGVTPLHCAVLSGSVDMVHFLVEHRADVNAVAKLDWPSILAGCPTETVPHKEDHSGAQAYLFVTGFVLDAVDDIQDASQQGHIPEDWLTLGGINRANLSSSPDAFWRTLVADRGPNGSNAPLWYKAALDCALSSSVNDGIDTRTLKKSGHPILEKFLGRVESVVWNRRLFRSQHHKRLGLGPKSSRNGDLICILAGVSVPVILRPAHVESHYLFIGECYMHGVMDGQAIDLHLQSQQGRDPTVRTAYHSLSLLMETFKLI